MSGRWYHPRDFPVSLWHLPSPMPLYLHLHLWLGMDLGGLLIQPAYSDENDHSNSLSHLYWLLSFFLTAGVLLQCLIIFYLDYSDSLLVDLPAYILSPSTLCTAAQRSFRKAIAILLCSSKPFSVSILPWALLLKLWFVMRSRQCSKS